MAPLWIVLLLVAGILCFLVGNVLLIDYMTKKNTRDVLRHISDRLDRIAGDE